MVKVITYGTFDLLHYGHVRLLERAKALGDYLIVGITSDDYDKTRGKINNQQSLMERIAAVKETGLADEIIVEEYEGQKIVDICRHGVDIFTVGSDWEGHFDYLNEFCKVIYLPRTEGVSSTEIRSEKRKVSIGAVGDENLCAKFKNELSFVNGAEFRECDMSFDGVDAVYIATHPDRHYSDVKSALLSGKHVICESPVALSEAECRELFQLAKDKQLVLVDAIKTAYSTAFTRLCVLAKSGRIGDIVSIDAVCTSLKDGAALPGANLADKQNSICAWGPTALLPVFQLLGVKFSSCDIVTKLLDVDSNFDAFTKVDLIFDKSVASIKVAKAAKAEGELVITGTKGYIYVPAPWWKTDYFEVRYENIEDNKRYFYQLDGEGIRYEIIAFLKSIESGRSNLYLSNDISVTISSVIERFNNREYRTIGSPTN